jgi:serine-type D-Ala-D-Ala carboxypeptidase/endopeptidase
VSRRFALLFALLLALAACSGASKQPAKPTPSDDSDPDGPHRGAVAAQVKPYLDAEVVSGLVVGLYDAGKLEIYGFGKGADGAPPNGKTLYEIGSVTKVYTSLLLADAVQRREVELETAVSELLPPGITVPTKDKTPITLKHLALHASGLPRLPPSLGTEPKADPYGGYGEEQLYQDLLNTELDAPPGTRIVYSNYGAGLLGHVLGRKIGGGFATVLRERVIVPLGLKDTFLGFPAGTEARRAQGTDEDLQPVPPWTFDALAGAGALVSTVRDQLQLIDAELDAAAGGKAPLRAPMRLTQEDQLEGQGPNTGLGWQIDREGRYWHNGGTGGYHAFVGFDPKQRRGVVILASTSSSLVDRLADSMYKVLDGSPPVAAKFPAPEQLVKFAGTYDFQGQKLIVTVGGKRLYIEGPGEPKHRMSPLSDHEFFIEPIQAAAVFREEDGKVKALLFAIGEHTLVANRVEN